MQYIYLLLLLFSLEQCYRIPPGEEEPKPPPIENDTIPLNNNGNDTIPLTNGNDTISPIDNDMDTIPEVVIPTILPHIEIARKNIGVPTKDSINHWLSFVGLPPNNPWCAASQSIWLHQAGVKEPLLKTGLARNYVYQTPSRLHVSAGRVLIGAITMPAGSLAIYQRGDTRFGHIGTITEPWTGERGMYISGNTSPPNSSGSEFSGGGVWEKPARIVLTSAFGIREFVYVNY